jgi:hypothetical protein
VCLRVLYQKAINALGAAAFGTAAGMRVSAQFDSKHTKPLLLTRNVVYALPMQAQRPGHSATAQSQLVSERQTVKIESEADVDGSTERVIPHCESGGTCQSVPLPTDSAKLVRRKTSRGFTGPVQSSTE